MKSFAILLLIYTWLGIGTAQAGVLDVRPSAQVVVEIDADSAVRTAFPDKLFGFNINYRSFQQQLLDEGSGQISKRLLDALRAFPSAIYRYPGGLVANAFDWTNAVGPFEQRHVQSTTFKQPPAKVRFGLDEYLSLLREVNGSFLYVLNLVGTDPLHPMQEAGADQVALKNQKLAQYLRVKDPGREHYYQLGNELDRQRYEWDAEKYVSRSRKTMDAISAVDKEAKFILFLRDFTWTYKRDKLRGSSHPKALMAAVLKGLPEVQDYSLHHYYDGKREDGKSRDLNFWLKRLETSIQDYRSLRGADPNIWITEHARQMSSDQPSKDLTVEYTSNLGGALSTADYLIAIAQIPQVKGAVWHGLNAGPWQLFDASVRYKDLRPRPIYWALRVLREMHLPNILETHTSSPNHSGYQGGYDVRAVAFANSDRKQLGLWLVNHYAQPLSVQVRYQPLAGRAVEIKHQYISGPAGRSPDDLSVAPDQVLLTEDLSGSLSKTGVLTLELPPTSVSTYLITGKL
jgi:alpha-L-arabinofuranosidase